MTEAAVVAMPDPFLGERVCAYIVSGDPRPTTAELTCFVRGRGLADSKVPDRIEFLDALPRTAVGKISKQQLGDRIAAALEPTGAQT
uniref:AMP-binding enzyme n=1 Tax=Streptomyces sp. CA-141956 TaxID=3240051 RepID=UPI003F49392A